MSVEIINNKSNIRLNFFGATHIFQKEDLTLQKFDTYIVFKDARQKQKVNYLDVDLPYSNNIDSLMDILIGYIDSKDTTSESIDLGNYKIQDVLNCILMEQKEIVKQLKKINK